MTEHKNIDRLFQEKFRDFEITPSADVWNKIETAIADKPKKDRRVFWLWFTGVAAGLALLLMLTNPFKTEHLSPVEKHTVEHQEKETIQISSPKSEVTKISKEITPKENQKFQKKKFTATPTIIKKATATKVSVTKESSSPNVIIKNTNHPKLKEEAIFKENKSNKKEEIALVTEKEVTPNKQKTQEKTIHQTILADNSITETEVLEKNNSRWTVSTLAAPVYLNSFNKNTSSIDKEFDNNTKQGSFSAAYGVQLAYQVSNRFSIQSGVHLVDYGYKTYDVYVYPSGIVSEFANIDYDTDASSIQVNAAPPTTPLALNETRTNPATGDLMQVFGYVEVPLEVKYNINKGDLGINLIGGFSTLFLNKNEIFIETEGLSSRLGEASNLNSINFSGNLGVEFDYKVYQNLHFNLVPMFKMQANTFEKNTGGFNPYAVGIYSGLNLRF